MGGRGGGGGQRRARDVDVRMAAMALGLCRRFSPWPMVFD